MDLFILSLYFIGIVVYASIIYITWRERTKGWIITWIVSTILGVLFLLGYGWRIYALATLLGVTFGAFLVIAMLFGLAEKVTDSIDKDYEIIPYVIWAVSSIAGLIGIFEFAKFIFEIW